MLDDWYRTLKLPMTVEQFHQLPRSPAYQYEHINDCAWMTPRPRTFNAVLQLSERPVATTRVNSEPVGFRSIEPSDWSTLPTMFAESFKEVAPFVALNEDERLRASIECLHQTQSGGDGPLIEPASFVAWSAETQRPLGAILITLIPKRDEGEIWDGEWSELPATESARVLLGRPHLTWVFVTPRSARHGVGSSLLDQSVNALLRLGYHDLGSTFLLGNESTMLWHWRNGFRVLRYAWSMRAR